MNLLLLAIAAATFAFARYQRNVIQTKSAILFQHGGGAAGDLNRIRDELSEMDMTQQQLAKELDAKLDFLATVNSEQFYISIDTRRKTMQLRLGKDIVREMPIELGEAKTITSKTTGKSWTFVPVKGAFSVTGKQMNGAWTVPEWLYAMNGQPPPAERPTIPNGLGRYVIGLSDNYLIHSPPPPESPLHGAKPGSIMASEQDLAAIWPRISTATRVYIF